MEFEKAKAELPILHSFTDFINSQVGVYCDSLSSFNGNKVRVERQIARVNRQFDRVIKNGQPVITWVSVEDPTYPDIIHHRIIKEDEFIKVNSEAGFNEQQTCWSIIVFIFAKWDEEIRPQIAKIRNVNTNEIKLNEFGDLRILRMNIIHERGFLSKNEFSKLTIMKDIATQDAIIRFNHDQMYKLFRYLNQGIARLILEYTGDLPGAPKASEIVSVAIQRHY